MKAVAYQKSLPADNSAALSIALPEVPPGSHDLQVEVRAISVNPVDTKVRRGVEPPVGEWKCSVGMPPA